MFTNGTDIPVVDLDTDFVYLGKRFNENMNKNNGKTNLIDKLKDLLSKISNLVLTPQMKIKIMKLAIYPKLGFDLKIYDFPHTWIINDLDFIVHYHLRKWLELPVSTCVEEIVRL